MVWEAGEGREEPGRRSHSLPAPPPGTQQSRPESPAAQLSVPHTRSPAQSESESQSPVEERLHQTSLTGLMLTLSKSAQSLGGAT